MGTNSLIDMEIWVDGSRDTTVRLSHIPNKGDKVSTHSYFSYRIYDIIHQDGGKIKLLGARGF